MRAYDYLDVWDSRGPWKRIRATELGAWLSRHAADPRDLFHTTQLFPSHDEQHDRIQHLVFDLDSSSSLDHARALVNWLEPRLEKDDLKVNFSGRRGFHVWVSGWSLGCHSQSAAKSMATEIARMLRLDIDETAYSERRMMRIVGSINSKGGLRGRCMRLTLEELRSLDMPGIASRSLVAEPDPWANLFRPSSPTPKGLGLVSLLLGDGSLSAYEPPERPRSRVQLRVPENDADRPSCVRDLLENGLREHGTRNKATLALVTYFKSIGVSQKETDRIVHSWASRQSFTTSSSKAVRADTEGVIKWAYSPRSSSFFSCRFICSVGSTEKPIKCDGNKCSHVNKETDTASEAISRQRLEDALDPTNAGKELAVVGVVDRKEVLPAWLPRSVRITCQFSTESKICDFCSLAKYEGGESTHEIFTNEKLIHLKDLHRQQQEGYIRSLIGIPKRCPGSTMKVSTEQTLLAHAYVQPYMEDIATSGEKQGFRENEVYIVGHDPDIQGVYLFEGVSTPHPKDSRVVQLVKKATPLRKDFEAFNETEDTRDALSIFRPDSGQTPEKKLEEIHSNLRGEAHGIIGRETEAIAVALVWFSPLRILGTLRGWLQVLALGDPGQGKSELTECFRKWFGYGSSISGENMSLAGLTMAATQGSSGGLWTPRLGELCRRDCELVIFEEFHGAPQEVISGLSEVMDTGIVRMGKVASGAALARTRKVLVSNCINFHGHSIFMSQRSYGIEHVPFVMRTPEDTRRIDYVIGFKKSAELDKRVTSASPNGIYRDNPYGKDLCRTLVSWVWSRKPEQVVMGDGTEQEAREQANSLLEKYSQKIPLLVSGEAWKKLIRIGAAVAGHTFSCDSSWNLVVKPEHITSAASILDRLYTSNDLQYDKYTIHKGVTISCEPESLRLCYRRIMVKSGCTFFFDAIKLILQSPSTWTIASMAELLDESRERVSELARCLIKEGIAERTASYSLRCTEDGIQALTLWSNDHADCEFSGNRPTYYTLGEDVVDDDPF